uniref:MedDCM-OCT-S30-C92-cds13 n=1 Tax=Candidatus Actinomarina minuta TaxID=1389454 RepID=S5DJQ6_9ACTN|nr:MedDCM-OCT-S30-C92-cds13 [Candidatus Actinomarina minuta]|tara:strand:- start:1125 stop:1739 length:615 start_codon:yes stop_codon:yes gene_type:complete
MKDSKIISRILRLDKNIYNELLVQKDSLQKSIFIYLTTSVLLTLGVFRFINGVLDFIKENLMAFQQELSTQEFSMIRSLIDELEVAFNSENAFSNIISSITSSVISSGIGLVIIYFVLKYLLRQESQPKNLLIIYCYSNIPGLLIAPTFVISSIFVQGVLVTFVAVFSIVTFGSGLKQVYSLRNIEVILLLVSWMFGSTILGSI